MHKKHRLALFGILLLLAATASAFSLDNYEDNDVSDWSNVSGAGSFTASVAQAYQGTHSGLCTAVKLTQKDGNNSSYYYTYSRTDDVNEGPGYGAAFLLHTGAVQICAIMIKNGGFYANTSGGEVQIGSAYAVNNTWYGLEIEYPDNNAKFTARVYDDSNNLIAFGDNFTPLNVGVQGKFRLYCEGANVYFDNTCYAGTCPSIADYTPGPPPPSGGIDVNINDTLAGTTITGNKTIDFNISSSESEIHLKIAASTSPGAFTCDINADLNISNYAVISGLNCADNNFEDSTNCTYAWSSWKSLSCLSDGGTYIDLNAWNYSGTYAQDINSSREFTLDNEPEHDANYTYTLSGALDPENGTSTIQIDLKNISKYRHVSTDSFQWDRNSFQIGTDMNITHTDGNYGDLNICYFVTTTYDYNADTWEDGNCITVHIKEYPQDVNFIYSPTLPALGQLVDFNGDANGPAITAWNFGFPDSNSHTQNTTYTFTSSGQKTICLTVQNFDDLNRTTCHDLNISGTLYIVFRDEKTGNSISPTVNFNDTNTITSGTFNQSLAALPETTKAYMITAWDGNRTARAIQLDLNRYSDFNIIMLLLDSDEGRDIEFQFYEPDELTLLADANVTAYIDENYIESQTLDSTGTGTFFLDGNSPSYEFHITAADGNAYVYYSVVVVLKIPKQEDSLATNITPFEVDVGGLARAYYGNKSTDFNFYVLGNTTGYYEIQVGDWNAEEYYDRYYFVRVIGGASTYNLQPYLVSVDNGIQSALYAVDSMDNPVEQAVFVIQKQLTGVSHETVEIVETDDTGRGITSWVVNDTYYIQVYYLNSYQGEVMVRPSLTSYEIRVITNNPQIERPTGEIVWMEYSSSSVARLVLNDLNQYHFDVNWFSPTGSIESITLTVTCAGSTVYTETKNINVANGTNFTVDLNKGTVSSCSTIKAEFEITTGTGTFIENIEYGLAAELISPFADLKTALGETTVLLLALFLTAVIAGLFAYSVTTNPVSVAIVAGASLGFFTAVGWVGLTVFLFAAFIAGIMSFLYLRWEVF